MRIQDYDMSISYMIQYDIVISERDKRGKAATHFGQKVSNLLFKLEYNPNYKTNIFFNNGLLYNCFYLTIINNKNHPWSYDIRIKHDQREQPLPKCCVCHQTKPSLGCW